MYWDSKCFDDLPSNVLQNTSECPAEQLIMMPMPQQDIPFRQDSIQNISQLYQVDSSPSMAYVQKCIDRPMQDTLLNQDGDYVTESHVSHHYTTDDYNSVDVNSLLNYHSCVDPECEEMVCNHRFDPDPVVKLHGKRKHENKLAMTHIRDNDPVVKLHSSKRQNRGTIAEKEDFLAYEKLSTIDLPISEEKPFDMNKVVYLPVLNDLEAQPAKNGFQVSNMNNIHGDMNNIATNIPIQTFHEPLRDNTGEKVVAYTFVDNEDKFANKITSPSIAETLKNLILQDATGGLNDEIVENCSDVLVQQIFCDSDTISQQIDKNPPKDFFQDVQRINAYDINVLSDTVIDGKCRKETHLEGIEVDDTIGCTLLELPIACSVEQGNNNTKINKNHNFNVFNEFEEISDKFNDSGILIPSTVAEVAALPDFESLVGKEPKKQDKKCSSSRKVRTHPSAKKKSTKNDQHGKSFQKPLWEFLLDVLADSQHNPSVIQWLDHDKGTFKIMKGSELANLWTRARNREHNLKYEFFARTLRHYYAKGILKRMTGKKLQYQFLPTFDWQAYDRNIMRQE